MSSRTVFLGLAAACLCGAAHAGPDQWVEVRSAHFTVLTDSNEKQGRHILDQFERMRWVFQALFPKANVDPADPILVLAAKNERVFLSAAPASFLAKGEAHWAGLYLQAQDKNYILMRLDASDEHPYATVYHEYTHMQFSSASEWMPIWLNEGLAEFMQNTTILDKNVELGQPSADDILYLRQNRLIPLDVLFRVDAKSPYYHREQKVSVFYSEAWALTHYLMVTAHEKHVPIIDKYMALMSQHEDPVTAAEKAFGDLKQLQAALDAYIHNGNYQQFVLSSAAAPINESSYKVRALAQPEADAARADILARVQRESEAQTIVENVLKADPNNVQAHETMGYLEFRANHLDEARKWYREAVKLDSADYLAYYYFAALSMSEPENSDDKDVEQCLRTAIQLNSRFAPAYDRLAGFYTARRENLDEAHRLSTSAIQLEPANAGYRINAANTLMVMDRLDDAIAVLRGAEKVAKEPAEAALVENRIETFEDIRAAREKAEAEEKEQAEAAAKTQATVQVAENVNVVEEKPKHPTAPATGRKHTATGVIRGVTCSYPSEIEFHLVTAAGKSFDLYNNDFLKIDLSTDGPPPNGTVNPCADFEGRKVELEYIESPDKTVDGQVMAILLRSGTSTALSKPKTNPTAPR